MVRNVADIYQSGQYSIEAQKVKKSAGSVKYIIKFWKIRTKGYVTYFVF